MYGGLSAQGSTRALEMGSGTAGELVRIPTSRTFVNLAHGDQLARATSHQLATCAEIVLPGKGKCVDGGNVGLNVQRNLILFIGDGERVWGRVPMQCPSLGLRY